MHLKLTEYGNHIYKNCKHHTIQVGLNADCIFGAYDSLISDELRNGLYYQYYLIGMRMKSTST